MLLRYLACVGFVSVVIWFGSAYLPNATAQERVPQEYWETKIVNCGGFTSNADCIKLINGWEVKATQGGGWVLLQRRIR